MPVVNPRAGRAFVWIIAFLLTLCILSGSICLMLFLFVSEYQATYWLPLLGFAFLALPWLFWILTCVYRVTSRKYGFRMVIGSLGAYGGGGSDGGAGGGGSLEGGGGGGAAAACDDDDPGVVNVATEFPPVSAAEDGRGVHLVASTGMASGENDSSNGGHEKKEKKNKRKKSKRQGDRSSSSSSDDQSNGSRESEMPLALSMAS